MKEIESGNLYFAINRYGLLTELPVPVSMDGQWHHVRCGIGADGTWYSRAEPLRSNNWLRMHHKPMRRKTRHKT